MARILGISGKKQSGKNTTANYIHGNILKELNLARDFYIEEDTGTLVIETRDSTGRYGWGEFDVCRKDTSFVQYAEREIWPYVKMYSFADGLKNLCVEFFGLKPDQVYGTDERKNEKIPHLLWENMPSGKNKKGPMTAREFMQFFGTDIMRSMHGTVHVDHAISRIKAEGSALSIIADVRFPNEVKSIQEAGGKVIRLTRQTSDDCHASECGLDKENFDWSNFDAVVENDKPLNECLTMYDEVYNNLFLR
ncbi:MAG: hypothetical protein FI729_02965 [SAR202 cluster bacterium]|jgi:hypothetical protein|nr:hypothetical protein [SAR202 cluster bacterium]|tara:strand:- start:3574 stop:4323 length:750 start_codon:yes stop_codon:yes gene_type:complete